MDTNDLVPQSAITELSKLDEKLAEAQVKMNSVLKEAGSLNSVLKNQAITYKELAAAITAYNGIENKILTAQKEHLSVMDEKDKVTRKVIESTSAEAKATENFRKNLEQTTSARMEEKTLMDLSKKAYDEATKKIEEQQRQYVALQQELKGTQNSIKSLDKEYKAQSVTYDQYIERKALLIDKEQDQKASIKTLGDTIKYNNQIIRTSIGSYDNLSAQYSRLKIATNGMSDAEKLNGKSKQELESHAQALYGKMNELQKATGKHQLQVGNYDLAVKDLTTTLRLVDPRIGAIVGRVQQLTPLKGAWIKVNDQLVKSLGVTSRIASALQFAIVGLVAGGIMLAIKAFKEWKNERDLINQAELEALENYSKETVQLKILYSATQDLNKSLEERKKAADELIKQYPSVFNNFTQEEILAGKSQAAYEDLTKSILATAKAKAYSAVVENIYKQMAELEIKKIELEEAISRTIRGSETFRVFEAKIGALDDKMKNLSETAETFISKINVTDLLGSDFGKNDTKSEELASKKAAEKIEKERERLAESEKKAYQDLALFRINQEAEANKLVLQDNKKTFDERTAALNSFVEKQMESISQSAKFQLSNDKLTSSQRALIKDKEVAELLKLQQESEKMQLDITKDYVEQQQSVINDAHEERLSSMAQKEQDALERLAEQYANDAFEKEVYEKRKLSIIEKYANLRMEAELARLEDILEISGLLDEEIEKIEKKIAAVRAAYAKEASAVAIKGYEDVAKASDAAAKKREMSAKELARKIIHYTNEASDIVFDAINNRFSHQLDVLSKESDINQEWRDNEISRIEEKEQAGVISAAHADAQKAYIEQQAQAREEEIEAKKREMQLKQARWEKANSIVQAAIYTARGVTAALPNLALVAITSALGAAQIATIAAQKIPEYAEGTGTPKHPGGLAIVGDGGRPEVAILPTGERFITPDYPTLVNMPRGTEVFPDMTSYLAKENARIPERKEEKPISASIDMKGMINEQKEVGKKIDRMTVSINRIRQNTIYSSAISNLSNRNKNKLS